MLREQNNTGDSIRVIDERSMSGCTVYNYKHLQDSVVICPDYTNRPPEATHSLLRAGIHNKICTLPKYQCNNVWVKTFLTAFYFSN